MGWRELLIWTLLALIPIALAYFAHKLADALIRKKVGWIVRIVEDTVPEDIINDANRAKFERALQLIETVPWFRWLKIFTPKQIEDYVEGSVREMKAEISNSSSSPEA